MVSPKCHHMVRPCGEEHRHPGVQPLLPVAQFVGVEHYRRLSTLGYLSEDAFPVGKAEVPTLPPYIP